MGGDSELTQRTKWVTGIAHWFGFDASGEFKRRAMGAILGKTLCAGESGRPKGYEQEYAGTNPMQPEV